MTLVIVYLTDISITSELSVYAGQKAGGGDIDDPYYI